MTLRKLPFRGRTLNADKPMTVFVAREFPVLHDFTVIKRAVPEMTTGMEQEEKTEHDLQRAMVSGSIIPTPEVVQLEIGGRYSRCYPSDWKVPRKLIREQPSTIEEDIPDYDMDSEDEKWISTQAAKHVITPQQFEEVMDCLEKSSGQKAVTLKKAKSLLKQNDDLITAIYNYWLNKRMEMPNPLTPQVKTEEFDSDSENPYIAFRRLEDKIPTRKHQKNDEAS